MSLWAFRFILIYLCVMIVQPQNRFPFLYHWKIADISFITGTLLHVMSVMSEGRSLIRLNAGSKCALTLIAFGMLTHYFGGLQKSTNWNAWIDIIVKNAALLLLLEATMTSIPRIWAAQFVVVTATLWWIKAGVRLSAAGATYSGDRVMGAAVGMVENPNAMAHMTCVILPLYFYFYENSTVKIVKMGFLALVATAVFVVLQTGSRTGMVILCCLSIGLFPRYGAKHKVTLIAIGVAGFFIMGIISPGNIERFKTIPASMMNFLSGAEKPEDSLSQDEQSAQERSLKNRDTWKLVKAYPLGVGTNPETSKFLSKFPYASGQVHNEFLMAGYLMGFPGIALYLTMLATVFRSGRKIQKLAGKKWPQVEGLGYTLKIQVIPLAVGGFFSPAVFHPLLMLVLASSSALVALVALVAEKYATDDNSQAIRNT